MDTALIVVTAVSLLTAAAVGVVAWRLWHDERRRSAARVAALAEEIHGVHAPTSASFPSPDVGELLVRTATPVPQEEMFAAAPPRSRFPLIAGVAVVVLAAAAAATLFVGGNREGDGARAPADGHAQVQRRANPATAVAPLELVALGHERDTDGLTVRGVLRNPSAGSQISHLSAVVLLFDRNGGYVAAGRAAVQSPTLEPGSETTFVITVTGAPEVARYRVSFRTDDIVVPHVDHRS